MPRYRTVLSILEWPNNSWTARRFPVRRQISVALVRRSEWVPTCRDRDRCRESSRRPGAHIAGSTGPGPAGAAQRTESRRAFCPRRGCSHRPPAGFVPSLRTVPARRSFLAHHCPLDGVSVRRNVFHLEGNDIATAQLAVDCKIEHRQVALAICDLELGADRPDVLRP